MGIAAIEPTNQFSRALVTQAYSVIGWLSERAWPLGAREVISARVSIKDFYLPALKSTFIRVWLLLWYSTVSWINRIHEDDTSLNCVDERDIARRLRSNHRARSMKINVGTRFGLMIWMRCCSMFNVILLCYTVFPGNERSLPYWLPINDFLLFTNSLSL